jgi:hypothetical protein
LKILIFSQKSSSRSSYVFKLLFEELLGCSFQITNDIHEFYAYAGPKCSYGKRAIAEELFFYASDLLFEQGIHFQETNESIEGRLAMLFPAKTKAAMPFDVFAAAFYLVSRYEEYLPHFKDQHGRFKANQSVLFKLGVLNEPVVNLWAQQLLELFEDKFGKISRQKRAFKFIPSIDIDNAYAYKHKGFIRAIAGCVSDLLALNPKHALYRLNVIFGLQKDPYDTYDYLLELIDRYPYKTLFFFLLGDFSKYDRNVPHQNRYMQELIKFLDDAGEAGIHPSYASHRSTENLKKEIARLSSILHREIHISRQHFLKFSLPETYQRLIECEIADDYSMGYAELPGFRAGIASSFNFYDLDLETETHLRIHPISIMDGTLKDYMNLEPEEASEVIRMQLNKVKAVNGTFIAVWHNESFAENKRWKGWRNVYETMLNQAHQHKI